MKGLRRHSYLLLFALILTAIFFATNLIILLAHEPWCDEANPWQIAKVINFSNLFEVTKYEPHSPLYPLFLAPFAQNGFPYITTNIISLIIATLAIFLMSWRAPFKKWQKVVLAFSAGFFYYNTIFARDYSLVLLGVVLVGLAYKSRFKHPILYALSLAFLSQTHILAGGFVAILALGFFVECFRRREFLKILLPAAILAAALLILLPPVLTTMSDHVIIKPSLAGDSRTTIFTFSGEFNTALFGIPSPILELYLVFLLLYLLARYPKIFVYTVFGFGFFFFTLYFIYNTNVIIPQKPATFITLLTIPLWLIYLEKRSSDNLLTKLAQKLELYKLISYYLPASSLCFIAPALSIPRAISESLDDYKNPYSFSMEVSDYLNTLEDNALIISGSDNTSDSAISLVPFLKDGREIYNAVTGEPFGYMIWNADREIASSDQVTSLISRHPDRPVYILRRIYGCPNVKSDVEVDDSWTKLREFNINNKAYDPPMELYKVR